MAAILINPPGKGHLKSITTQEKEQNSEPRLQPPKPAVLVPFITCSTCGEEYAATITDCPHCRTKKVATARIRHIETFGQAAHRATHIDRPPAEAISPFKIIPDVDLSDEQLDILKAIDDGTPVILVTGKAGTGKSTLIEHIRATSSKRIAAVAFTGIAALNIKGQTIHSFFRFPHEPITEKQIEQERKTQRLDLLEKLELLIIDEISMVRADLMDGIDWYLRLNRPPEKSQLPFGGVQVIMLGDPYQLEPFASIPSGEAAALANIYPELFFFNAKSLAETSFLHLSLTTVFRQTDRHFVDLLNNIREGIDIAQTLEKINTTCKISPPPDDSTTLTPRRDRATQINEDRLNELPGQRYEAKASYSGTFQPAITENQKEARLPAPDPLLLKVGARVIFLKNDKKNRWVNGSTGTVEKVIPSDKMVQVRLDKNNRVVNVEREVWKKEQFYYSEQLGDIVAEEIGSFTQYPLAQAWAVTVHKAQGQTIEKIHVDLDSGAFSAGQTYVALSRCPEIGGITLGRPIKPKDIIISDSVTRFMAPLA